MSTQLATVETPLPIPSASQAIVQIIAQNASNPACDVGKMQALLDMQIRVMGMEAKSLYDAAMSRLQMELPEIVKEKKGSNGKYASIENIDAAIGPLLQKHGFHFTFTSAPQPGNQILITGKLNHSGGHHEPGAISLALDKSGSKNDTQGGGSTIAYGRRYLKCMMLDLRIVGEDRDGATEKTITDEQAMTIETLIGNIKDEPAGYRLRCQSRLLGAMAVEKISDIPQKRFGEAVNKLEIAAKGPMKQ